jgi:hypothetical protein
MLTVRHDWFPTRTKSLRMLAENADAAADSLLSGPSDRTLPSEQEEVVATKTAPAGLKQPLESYLNRISDTDSSELDRSAMWTTCGEDRYYGADHDSKHQLSPHCPPRGRHHSALKAWSKVRGGRCAGWCRGGSPPLPLLVVPVFSGRAPTIEPVVSRAKPGAYAASVISCSSVPFPQPPRGA